MRIDYCGLDICQGEIVRRGDVHKLALTLKNPGGFTIPGGAIVAEAWGKGAPRPQVVRIPVPSAILPNGELSIVQTCTIDPKVEDLVLTGFETPDGEEISLRNAGFRKGIFRGWVFTPGRN